MKDLLAYLRLILNPADRVSFERIVNVPPRKIGKRTVETLQQWAETLQVAPYQALHLLAEGRESPIAPGPRKALLRFREIIEELTASRDRADLLALFDWLLDRLNMRDFLLKEYGEDDGNERWSNVQELRRTAGEYQHLPGPDQLPAFLESVALFADLDQAGHAAEAATTDAVICTTLHQAKGLEFPVVFLIGLEEGLLPHTRSLEQPDAVEEERRLLYVGATRARERLYLLRAFRRATYGSFTISEPSRFLADIPPHLVERVVRRERASLVAHPEDPFSRSRQGPETPSWWGRGRGFSSGAPPSASARVPEARFGPGQRVRHQNYGEGVVVSSKLIPEDEEVVVNFHEHGPKRMLASFGRLEAIE
ncbi:MAG: ATP-binding domain-containing protein [Chloroflexaceae bacterium]|nr:ATP-binding domain-containing protein [Chloroflexaceae bacterium]